ncbi:MAG: DNA cytosine methyltransferase [Chloroflexi bacterium]|nr:DNA cytosine methyltransferase [Chloroflexota bacterium]
MTSLCAVDLFCGAGGLTRGLLDEGVRVLAGYDLDPACRYPYEHNNGVPFVEQDVSGLDPAEVAGLFPKGVIRTIAGCAPCQPYSNYSRGRKPVYEDRWHLIDAYRRIVEHVRPELATIENVLQLRKHPSYAELVKTLKEWGYHWTEFEVKCRLYGVPQTRTRLVGFASVFGPVELIAPTYCEESRPTVRHIIGRLPSLAAGGVDPHDRLHVASRLAGINLKRIRKSQPGGTWRDWDDDLVAACHKAKTGKTYPSVYGRMEWGKPGPTITTQFYGFGNGRFGHPDQDRGLSLREGALLQTFPPTYEFVPPKEQVHFKRVGRLIGNAVPVLLARAVARSLKGHVEQHGA